ncbi:hypothetical protein EMIHUDRAFT_442267 [Emiliania huxleyi CCMP1516]|uniref:Sugar phosphate transporter domain-containing protein n=2 Tax=Emiliania huxleyi TaxID=2903 RepID=A0A0D3K6N6_EMIH1|nr:hypothetical protein EMIHUDRAFT_442267 [Emiliania huxleyi CCMP1516]EOD31421.1 hypothetical protein EMIHUDRAFT_442267 [Emiliania huxleyi CCMP1516]|eukprot:XP_005783850.1 hypothetical protein EMIHUDRAFT_442267 [Emiliania huxleyi CCMP1516]
MCVGVGIATLAVALASPVGPRVPVAAARASAASAPRAVMVGMEPRRSPRLRAKEPSLLADAAESAAGRPGSTGGWLVRHRSLLLLIALVLHKCATDGLTRWTRLQTSYSGATVAVLSEVFKFPLIVAAICSIGGGASQIAPVFKEALSKPLGNCWIALCYTFNNLLYFDALSALSAVAYQVLSQSKTVFTAGLMFLLVGKRLRLRQVLAIGMLIAGAVTVNMQELARASASATAAGVAPAAVLWGVFLVLFSSFISALPNVAYEKVLKTEGENQYVNNVQVTVWIMIWIGVARILGASRELLAGAGAAALPSLSLGGLAGGLRAAFDGFTPAVWGVILLKALNGLLIPATFKYADNILYSYAKPSSIVVTTLVSAAFAGVVPAPSLLIGVALVVSSVVLYSSKPKAGKAD